MRPRASNEKELQTPCLKALAALFSRALVDCLRAAIAFSAAPTRSAPIWPFHLSYTGRVAFTQASLSDEVASQYAHDGSLVRYRLRGSECQALQAVQARGWEQSCTLGRIGKNPNH